MSTGRTKTARIVTGQNYLGQVTTSQNNIGLINYSTCYAPVYFKWTNDCLKHNFSEIFNILKGFWATVICPNNFDQLQKKSFGIFRGIIFQPVNPLRDESGKRIRKFLHYNKIKCLAYHHFKFIDWKMHEQIKEQIILHGFISNLIFFVLPYILKCHSNFIRLQLLSKSDRQNWIIHWRSRQSLQNLRMFETMKNFIFIW